MEQQPDVGVTPQTRIPTLLIVFCVHVLLLVGRCEFRPNLICIMLLVGSLMREDGACMIKISNTPFLLYS